MQKDELDLLRESLAVYEADKQVSVQVDPKAFAWLLDRVDELGQRQSKVMALQDLRSTELRLLSPLYVTVEPGEPVLVSSADLDIFGYGDTEDEAIRDFCECVVESYRELKSSAGSLGPHLARIWNFLSGIVVEA